MNERNKILGITDVKQGSPPYKLLSQGTEEFLIENIAHPTWKQPFPYLLRWTPGRFYKAPVPFELVQDLMSYPFVHLNRNKASTLCRGSSRTRRR